MSLIKHKFELIIVVGAVVFIAVLLAGCLGSGAPKVDLSSIQCSESLGSGQNLTINETQNNAVICAKLNSSLIIELTDMSRTGGEWAVIASPGLQISDEGTTWYENGTPTIIPGAGIGIRRWNVTIDDSGLQTVHADPQFAGRSSSPVPAFNLTIVVE